jgi:hypothetical protein
MKAMTRPIHIRTIPKRVPVYFVTSLILLVTLATPMPGQAKVNGHCSDCHTMHNSQDGGILTGSGPNQALLRQDCVGCHTGQNDGSAGSTPFVHHTGDVNYGASGIEGDTLAGGTFRYIQTDGAMGHNVAGIDLGGGPGLPPPRLQLRATRSGR